MRVLVSLLLFSALSCPSASAFVTKKSLGAPTTTSSARLGPALITPEIQDSVLFRTGSNDGSLSSTALPMTNVLAAARGALMTPIARRLLLVCGAAFLLLSKQYKRILWPGSASDPTSDAPLPPGSFGCPLFGSNMLSGSEDYGPNVFFDRRRRRLGNPKLFKFYAFGAPAISVSGGDAIKAALKDEFQPDGINTMMASDNWAQLFGDESILYESDKDKHAMLRRLVGAAMSPAAITTAIPSIQAAANNQIDRILASEDTVIMEDVCNDFTLDVAWKTILGLDLKDDEVEEFREKVKGWISGMFNPLFLLPFSVPGIKRTKAFKGHDYLVSKVEEKLSKLDEDGSDGSTLSAMYFATDDDIADADDTSRKLTRKQVIDNALILIFAGSETSATTLTCSSLILGLHPGVWDKVKQEQETILSKHGDDLTKASLDACTYLDSVLKETLRIKPIEGMELRKTEKTLVIDGQQVPRGWFVFNNVKETHINDPVTREEDESHMDVRKGFDPDRWQSNATKPSAWFPFGEGGRRCLGERLAMTEMKIFLATLARQVDYDLVNVGPGDTVKWKKISAMARPLDGVEIKPRKAIPVAS